jgi:uncharacterized SAM-binding protein YcdF (DUF218 family)
MLLLSKFVNLLAQPLNWIVLVLVLGLLRGLRNPREGRYYSVLVLALLLLTGFDTIPDRLVSMLEEQYTEMPPNADLSGYAGMVVLGGGLEAGRLSRYHQPQLNDSAERMTAAVSLWQHHPHLRLVFTGGEGELFGKGPSEAERARRFFDSMGVTPTALTLESQSQNTYDNAVFTARIPGVDVHQRWLLVTSAWHMPRALATFQKAGWNVTPYPVDFRTAGVTPLSTYNLADGAKRWELLLHELIGIATYRMTERM